MKKTMEFYEIHYVESDDCNPTTVQISRDCLGGLDIFIPNRHRDRADLTKLLRQIADDLDKHFPD